MIVTIHQPDFMPWLGLFNKIKNADEFIILDHTINNPKSPALKGRNIGGWIAPPILIWRKLEIRRDTRHQLPD